MTLTETATLLQTIAAMWPTTQFRSDEMTVRIWHRMLADLPGAIVAAAVERMASTLKFPPTIADIRGAVADATHDATGALSAGEAWRKVIKAIGSYGYNRPNEAQEFLGPEIWRAVEMIGGWVNVCLSDDPETVRSAQFERRYNAMIEQRKEMLQIPQQVRDDMKRLIGPLTERMMIGDGQEVEHGSGIDNQGSRG